MSRARRTFSAEQKAQVVRRHLADKQPVSQLADELQVQPGLIHAWINQLLTQAERVFQSAPANGQGRAEQAKDRRIEQLQARLVQKNEVIAELLEENVKAKKEAGEL
jgi:transposase-like protein